ncbi:MAG: FlgD immunoglobulin-like domain containing protein [candidate division Zixibacteria bacterium]|nr:FlgD immunoglobulin-like domain containing protein [candidate division Zixibacteria bacterium]
MRNVLLTFLFGLALGQPLFADIPTTPDQTLLWNHFNSVTIIKRGLTTFALATSRDGISVMIERDYSPEFFAIRHLFLSSEPIEAKLDGSILVLRSSIDILYFIDVSNLPEIYLIGEVDVDEPFEDYLLHGRDLYLAHGFEGLWRYSVDDIANPQFLDSSMLGIHYTQLERVGETLFALDDYNGILLYDIAGSGFGDFLDYLFVPFQVSTFAANAEYIIVGTLANSVLKCTYTNNDPQIRSTVTLTHSVDQLMLSNQYALALPRGQPLATPIQLNVFVPSVIVFEESFDSRLNGFTLFTDNVTFQDTRVYFPSAGGGIISHSLDTWRLTDSPLRHYRRTGPINDIVIDGDYLYTGGTANPLEVYRFSTSGKANRDTVLNDGINHIKDIESVGDTVLVLYPQLESILGYRVASGTFPIVTQFPADSVDIARVKYLPLDNDTMQALVTIGQASVNIFSLQDTLAPVLRKRVTFIGRVLDVELVDSLLVVSTSKKELWVYRLLSDLKTEFRSRILLSQMATDLIVIKNPVNAGDSTAERLFALGGSTILRFDLTLPSQARVDSTLLLPFDIVSSAVTSDTLFTVGASGIGMFDISGGNPVLIDFGGRGGSMIAAGSGRVAVSDGRAINIFLLNANGAQVPVEDSGESSPVLLQNFPNPFNPTTTISFSLSHTSAVRLFVLNILGQTVATLVDEQRPAGSNSATWDGRSDSGEHVASGLYFYRLTVGNLHESRKMLLIR